MVGVEVPRPVGCGADGSIVFAAQSAAAPADARGAAAGLGVDVAGSAGDGLDEGAVVVLVAFVVDVERDDDCAG